MSLVEFLLARIAEDESVARSLTSTAWVEGIERSGSPGRWRGIAAHIVSDATAVDSAGIIPDDAEVLRGSRQAVTHAARHDPARVLAECAAKRRLIEHETASRVLHHDTPWAEQFYAKGAHRLIGQYGEVIASNPADVEALIREYSDAVADTPVLRIMALAYATHPDYDTEWAPH